MRVRIQDQLCLLIALTSLLALMVLAVSTWVQSHRFVLNVRSSSLSLTANLKGAQVSQDLSLYQDLVQSVSSRTLIQEYLKDFNNGNTSKSLLDLLATDLISALSGGNRDTLLLQAMIYAGSDASASQINGIVNVTGFGARHQTVLPYTYANGSSVYLGDPGSGYPSDLYPNFTDVGGPDGTTRVQYDGTMLDSNSTLVLGPLFLPTGNSSLLSITVPMINNTSVSDTLGWLTVILDARLLYGVVESIEGLGQTGQILIVGPPGMPNLFSQDVYDNTPSQDADIPVWFVLSPESNSTLGNRHNLRAWGIGNPDLTFTMGSYPSVLEAYANDTYDLNNAGSHISTHNEEGIRVSTGYAQVNSDLVDWVIVFEQSHEEVVHPITQFRNIVLICVFSVVGAIILVCFPIAHCAVIPIKQLQAATSKSIATYETEHSRSSDSLSKLDEEKRFAIGHPDIGSEAKRQSTSSTAILNPPPTEDQSRKRKRVFQIPEKVPDKKHLVKDELTDLTGTFNEMSDELRVQYARLEERVRARTIELEHSRNVARAASESKTLFIANISHELRTPLNGIIGMCTIAIQENSLRRVRQSLKIIYKSSDLLLHLLNDLITFSRNSYGQQLAIEDGYFRLTDIKSQLLSIFERQAKESKVDLRVLYLNEDSGQVTSDALRKITSQGEISGPTGTGVMKDMNLRGDKNRILQILMNLVSNSLKFTPQNGAIELRIRCRGYTDRNIYSRKQPSNGTQKIMTNEKDAQQSDTIPDTSIDGKYLLFDFEVEDTGAGIPEDMQQEVFKPFVQGDAALSKKHGGTGLGLAICAQLASLMGGKVVLKSTPGIGSTFTFSLPLRYTTQPVPSMPTSLAGSLKSGSKPNSILSSLRDEFGPEPRRVRTRDPSPTTRSMLSHRRTESQPEVPRVVGFSNPYIADSDSMYENEQTDRQGMSARRLSRGNIEIKEDSNGGDYDSSSTVKGPEAQRNSVLGRSSASPVQRPGTPNKKNNPSKLSIIKSNGPSMNEKQPESIAQPLRVLVAEDNKVNQEVIKRMLRLEKVTDVTVAEDGQEAFETVQKAMNTDTESPETPASESSNPEIQKPPAPLFDVIFMDIQMPRMDGIQSTRKIREIGFEGPIVALTAFTDDSNREACADAGMQSFLGKPIKRPALKEILAKVRESSTGDGEDMWKS